MCVPGQMGSSNDLVSTNYTPILLHKQTPISSEEKERSLPCYQTITTGANLHESESVIRIPYSNDHAMYSLALHTHTRTAVSVVRSL